MYCMYFVSAALCEIWARITFFKCFYGVIDTINHTSILTIKISKKMIKQFLVEPEIELAFPTSRGVVTPDYKIRRPPNVMFGAISCTIGYISLHGLVTK